MTLASTTKIVEASVSDRASVPTSPDRVLSTYRKQVVLLRYFHYLEITHVDELLHVAGLEVPQDGSVVLKQSSR